MSRIIGPIYDRRDYAGFWRRSLALLIDGLILGGVYALVGGYWYNWGPESWRTVDASVRVYFGLFLFILAYCFFFRLTEGGTLGYRIVGIRYAYMLGPRAAFFQRSYRAAITMFLCWRAFVIDHFWILFDPQKQTWHDKVSGFYVVRRRARPIGEQPIVQRIVNFMMFSFVVWEPADSRG